ncbi:MAG: L-serine ammonia-lyase, iron-sulfur-dependent, subunit alpha [Spirochaetes bacterium]|nr:L-serine ammonia-lyase, iron-sulfur-dependent, subunit alpha [Spirochaetota bacterium]
MQKVTGCTEPASISFAFSRASCILKDKIGVKEFSDSLKAKVFLSRDVYRNASTVKIPFLRLKGIKPSVAWGICHSSISLNIFTSAGLKEKKKILKLIKKPGWLKIIPLQRSGLYIKAELKEKNNDVRLIIEDKHDSIKKIIMNNRIIFLRKKEKRILIKDLSEIDKIVKKNNVRLKRIAREFIMEQGKRWEQYGFKNAPEAVEKLVLKRMEGEEVPIITITGSGNQGILLALPFYELYKKVGNKILPAALFSILTQIYLTQKEGRISHLCGLANKTAPALIAGLSYYKGNNLKKIKNSMSLVKETLKGWLCKGANKNCALKAFVSLTTVFKIILKESTLA